MDIIARTYKRAHDHASPLTLADLADVFGELRGSYAEEYTLYNLSSLAGPLLVPPMRRFLSDWEPLRDPQGPAQAMRAWRGLLKTEKFAGAEEHVGGDAIAFVQLVENVLLPKVLTATAGWDPKTMTEAIVRLVEAWEPILPRENFRTYINAVIIPKLKTHVDDWNPKIDPVPIHEWLHPWLPYIENELEEFYPVIRCGAGHADVVCEARLCVDSCVSDSLVVKLPE